jgi:hypothetical protein
LGICIGQSAQRFADFNTYGLQWYFLFFYLFWIVLMIGSQLTGTVKSHKYLLLAWTTLALAFMPIDIERSLFTTTARVSSAGNGLKVAGLIMMIFPLFGALLLLGVDETSPIRTLDIPLPSFPSKKKEEQFQQPQAFVPPEPFVPSYDRTLSQDTLNNRISAQVQNIPSPAIDAPVQRTITQNSGQSLPAIPVSIPMTSSPEPVPSEIRARALYPYEANPADPNEISFGKDEIMIVTDDKGKWWHVVKMLPDGTRSSGIAPSNYLKKL